ncbi:glycosyltransferase family 2 protein [Candidatus Dependentiae bacterium]
MLKQKTINIALFLIFTASVTLSAYDNAFVQNNFVIVIPSWGNQDRVEENLKSVYNQDYDNYRVIYLNDASKDKTGERAEEIVAQLRQTHRTTIIHNKENVGALANHYKAVHMCQDHEIIVHLDGDDQLKHEHVLQILNKAYQDPNIWMTYGQYEEVLYQGNKVISANKGHCKGMTQGIVKLNAYREYDWVSSHLRSFRAGLFKHIKLKDLMKNGHFFRSACDMAFMYPLLELSGGKFKFIDEILYCYNCSNPHNVFRKNVITQLHNKFTILSKEKYSPLETDGIPNRDIPKHAKADLIIFSENNPAQLKALLESACCFLESIGDIHVLHTSQDQSQDKAYATIKKDFYNVTFIPISETNLKEELEKTIQSPQNNHILLAKDTMVIKDFVNISSCIEVLEQTYAYGFYLALGKNIKENYSLERKQNITPHSEIKDGIYAWQFKNGEHDWRNPNNLLMTLYRKKDILNALEDLHFDTAKKLEKNWNKSKFDMGNIGLFFEKSKAVTIACEKEKTKINIALLYLIKNVSTICKWQQQ